MSKLETFKNLWKSNRRGVIVAIYNYVIKSGLLNKMSDKRFLDLTYWVHYGRKIDWDNPKTFNEKLQWLKLYNRNPEYTRMVDKYEVKKYVAKIIGDQYIIPTIGVWDRVEDIPFDNLPEQYVIKCTHDSGSVCICRDKNTFDVEKAKRKLSHGMKQNLFYWGREWPYKDVKPRIIAEKYLEDKNGEQNDYKVFNFDGLPQIIEIDYNRFIGHLRQLYTKEWELIDAEIEYPKGYNRVFDRPVVLDEMLKLAEKLSKGHPFLRTEFYLIDGTLYFGELTFYHDCVFSNITPESFSEELGSWILLPKTGGGKIIKHRTLPIYILLQEGTENCDLRDYKLMCFNGQVKCSFVCSDRFNNEGLKVTFFDRDWEKMPFCRYYPAADYDIQKPANYIKMIELAETLSKGMPFVRVDFYEVNNHIYFGELTFFPGNGVEEFKPKEWDYTLGSWIELKTNKPLN